ncbi:hypothetical protein RJZ57_008555, partial [Blastomyces gilchristii]
MNPHPTAQIAAYITNVHWADIQSIMGRNVSPTTKLAPQFVPVASAEPSERTPSGNSSDCCQGIVPMPEA